VHYITNKKTMNFLTLYVIINITSKVF